jgi:hypothetical protein
MKNILIILALLIGLSINAQELKGFNLGDKYTGNENVITTLGGINGLLIIQTLDDDRIYSLMFLPSNDGKNITRIYYTDFTIIKKGFEYKYGIKLKTTENDDGSYSYSSITGGVMYFISTDSNRYLSPPIEMSCSIHDTKLYDIHTAEEQAKANTDF